MAPNTIDLTKSLGKEEALSMIPGNSRVYGNKSTQQPYGFSSTTSLSRRLILTPSPTNQLFLEDSQTAASFAHPSEPTHFAAPSHSSPDTRLSTLAIPPAG